MQSDGAYVTYTPSGGADSVTKKLGEPACKVLQNAGKMANSISYTAQSDIDDGLVILFDNNVSAAPNLSIGSGSQELLSQHKGTSSYLSGNVWQLVFRVKDISEGEIITATPGSGSAYCAMIIISF